MSKNVIDLFNTSAETLHQQFTDQQHVMSFSEYLEAFEAQPTRHLRDAARYLLDAIDFFGKETVDAPWGKETRFKIFDQAFGSPEERLVGQEATQMNIREAVASQVRDGKVNRLILIHGPNGSAKSTTIRNLFNGLDYFSTLEEGALHRFRWIFPTRKTAHGTIGFGARLSRDHIASFAHLEDDEIDATLECEVRDHPLLLLPVPDRLALIKTVLEKAGISDFQIPEHFLRDSLCHRCRQVADALIRTHKGDLRKVLAHVQVERWTMSRRYQRGTVQVGPQMSTDAGQRQITADRSLAALPVELQNMTLFETFGSLVDGSSGIVEFEDMLKRPLESFKYLLNTIETGEVLLGSSILKLNTVLMATTNDAMLEAFREHHEFQSFRDRITLVAVPFIMRRSVEQQIYELQLVPKVERHVAPHAVAAVAYWAVLSRLLKPSKEHYPESLQPIIEKLSAGQKAELYDSGTLPEGLSEAEGAALLGAISDIRNEHMSSWSYEGRYGPSPRLIRQVLLRASMSDNVTCLSPYAVLDELDAICGKVREYPFLEREVEEGGYHDFRAFVGHVEEWVLEQIERDVRTASGLVEESRYLDLLSRYVSHVRYVVKGEKVRSETTGQDEDPDESMMQSVEEKLGITGDKDDFRKGLISRIAAWALEHPKQKVDVEKIFPEYLRRIRDAYFQEHRKKVVKVAKNALTLLSDGADSLEAPLREAAVQMMTALKDQFGYCDDCMKDSLARLISKRFDSEPKE